MNRSAALKAFQLDADAGPREIDAAYARKRRRLSLRIRETLDRDERSRLRGLMGKLDAVHAFLIDEPAELDARLPEPEPLTSSEQALLESSADARSSSTRLAPAEKLALLLSMSNGLEDEPAEPGSGSSGMEEEEARALLSVGPKAERSAVERAYAARRHSLALYDEISRTEPQKQKYRVAREHIDQAYRCLTGGDPESVDLADAEAAARISEESRSIAAFIESEEGEPVEDVEDAWIEEDEDTGGFHYESPSEVLEAALLDSGDLGELVNESIIVSGSPNGPPEEIAMDELYPEPEASEAPTDRFKKGPEDGDGSSSLAVRFPDQEPLPAMTELTEGGASGGEPSIGDRLLQRRFELTLKLGGDKRSLLFEAEDALREDLVTLRLLRPERLDKPRDRQRFLARGRRLSAFSHPALQNIYDLHQDDGLPFYAMEHLDGQSLAAALHDRRALGERFEVAEAVAVGREMCAVLSYLHENGASGSAEPEAVWLTDDGRILLTDAVCEAEALEDQATLASTIVAMLAAPDQGLEKALSREDLPEGLAAALRRAGAEDPAARYPSIRDLDAALDPAPALVSAGPARAGRAPALVLLLVLALGTAALGASLPEARRRLAAAWSGLTGGKPDTSTRLAGLVEPAATPSVPLKADQDPVKPAATVKPEAPKVAPPAAKPAAKPAPPTSPQPKAPAELPAEPKPASPKPAPPEPRSETPPLQPPASPAKPESLLNPEATLAPPPPTEPAPLTAEAPSSGAPAKPPAPAAPAEPGSATPAPVKPAVAVCEVCGPEPKSCARCAGEGQRTVKCGLCQGTGLHRQDCPVCLGSGGPKCETCQGMGKGTKDCSACKGKKRSPCLVCKGASWVPETCGACSGRKAVACESCAASGVREAVCETCRGGKRVACPTCEGRRRYRVRCDYVMTWFNGKIEACKSGKITCPLCEGSGDRKGRPCLACDGEGSKDCMNFCTNGFRDLDCTRCDRKGQVACFARPCAGRGRWKGECPTCIGLGRRPCEACRGQGFRSLDCVACQAKGLVDCATCAGEGREAASCPRCSGKGRQPCEACQGRKVSIEDCPKESREACDHCQGAGRCPRPS